MPSRLRYAVSPERDIEIITEPGRQGDMPTMPEFRYGGGLIRPIEIVPEAKTQHLGGAYGNIGISGEVAVYLEGKEQGRQDQRQPGVAPRVPIDGRNKDREAVRNDDLLEYAPHHQLDPTGHLRIGENVLFPKLVEHILWSLYRACRELREKYDEKGIISEVFLKVLFSAVNLNHVAHALKGLKGETQGENDVQYRYRIIPMKDPRRVNQATGKETQIFEGQENKACGRNAGRKPDLSRPPLRPLNKDGRDVANSDHQKEDGYIGRNEGHVEHGACSKQKPPTMPMGEHVVEPCNNRKKNDEVERGE